MTRFICRSPLLAVLSAYLLTPGRAIVAIPFEQPSVLVPMLAFALGTALLYSRYLTRRIAADWQHQPANTTAVDNEVDRLRATLNAYTPRPAVPLTTQTAKLAQLSDRHQHRAGVTTTAAAEAAESAASIANAAAAMNGAIGEIEHQADAATGIARRAVAKAQEAGASVNRLTDRADQITAIVAMIRGIAERTNMLALNAAIEAARAGEHGEGFAIVANEVKALARQTAAATADIENKLGDAREVSRVARAEMLGVQEVVEEITGAALAIKGALAQQHAATRDISCGAERTTAATRAVTDGIGHALVTTEEIRGICEHLNAQMQTAR